MRGPLRGGTVAGMTHEERLALAGMTADELRRWVRDTRAAQGLPPTVEDGPALDRMAALVTRNPVESRERPGGTRRG